MTININDLTLGQIKEIGVIFGRDGADLRGANLGDADLGGARLRGADLYGADLGGDATPQTDAPFEVGKAYLFRTVTHIVTGRVTQVSGNFVQVKDAAWIADTGRYSDAILSGNFSEVEPYPDNMLVWLNAAALIDAPEMTASLPRSQK